MSGQSGEPREWVILECLDAFRDELGRPGQHKVPVTDLAKLYTRAEAFDVLGEWVERFPDREFSMRRVEPVAAVLDALAQADGTDSNATP